jgi:hypothetical protein
MAPVPQWKRLETQFTSSHTYPNPLQDVRVEVRFTSPSGSSHIVDAFWDGGQVWRVRFCPDEVGAWTYNTLCSDTGNEGLHQQGDTFQCTPAEDGTVFEQHGPIRLSENRRHLVYADGTPFFWLGDTAWNGPLWSTDDEWEEYLNTRVRQKFTAVQWITTQWLAAPDGDIDKQRAYTGHERIEVNPAFFQRMDRKIQRMNDHNLLAVPVLLWTAGWSADPRSEPSPGLVLPEDQCIVLARYMVARWGFHAVVWILPGDGDYHAEKAERWKRIGRGVFGGRSHAPVSLHPRGTEWNIPEFLDEEWLDIIGYQSGHAGDVDSFHWLTAGPPAQDWHKTPIRPFINLEPPYEDIVSYGSRQLFTEHAIRRALYWSVLVSPTAGVTYGAHGVWGWDLGGSAPIAHDKFGVTRHWREALTMPAADQLQHLSALFKSIPWWTLHPAPDLLTFQPGKRNPEQFIAAARTHDASLALIYTPGASTLYMDTLSLQPSLPVTWFNPRTGETAQHSVSAERTREFNLNTPDDEDWVLIFGNIPGIT